MTVANGEFHVFLKRTEYSDKCIASFKMIYNVFDTSYSWREF